jgi:hypothetical protein
MPPVSYSSVIPFPPRIETLAAVTDKSEFEYGQKQPRVLEFTSSSVKSNTRILPPGPSKSNRKQVSRPNEVDYNTSIQDLSYFANANIPVSMTRETIPDEYIPTEIWNHVSAKHSVAVDRLSQRTHLVQFDVFTIPLRVPLAKLTLVFLIHRCRQTRHAP